MLIILKSLNGYFLLAVNLSKGKKKQRKNEREKEEETKQREIKTIEYICRLANNNSQIFVLDSDDYYYTLLFSV